MALTPVLLRHPAACAAASGVLLALCFPRPHFSLLAWVALVPLLAVLVQQRSRLHLFSYGWLAGGLFFGFTCAWIYDVMRVHGNLSFPAAGGVLLLFVLVTGLFFGMFSLLVGELARRWQLGALLAAPFVWVAVEWLRTYVPFGGFPWNLLGYAVAPHVGWIQPAAYTGVYGVSFLLVAVNGLAASAWLAPSRRKLMLLTAVAVILAGTAEWGRRLPPVPTTERALLVQTNLPQTDEFDPEWAANHPDELARLDGLTRAAAQEHAGGRPALIVWPEVPVSFYFHDDPVLRARFLQLAQATRSYLLIGVVDFQRDPDGKRHPTNSAVLLGPDGGYIGQYDKIHLVPFGEYVPLGGWLGWLEPLTQEVSDFRPGRAPAALPADVGRPGILICYEAIFPGLVRRSAAEGAEVLVNLSNDGWYGRSAALPQHLNMARVRAVETRRFLLRATNTGITAVVDPYGRVTARAPVGARTALAAGFAPRRGQTLYVRQGDWFAALCAFVSLAVLSRKLWITAVEGTD